jgi:hypothetical protein
LGNIQWLKVLGGSSYDSPLANPIEIKRGFYELHLYSSSNDFDLADCPVTDLKKRWIVIIDSTGVITKQNFLSAEDDLLSYDGVLLQSGDHTILIGTSNANSVIFPAPDGHQKDDGAIAIFDTLLALIDLHQYGGSGIDRFQRCVRDFEGNFYIFGYSESKDFDLPNNYNDGKSYDYWVCKVNSDYQIEWSQNFGGSENGGDLNGGNLVGNILLQSNQLNIFTGAVMPINLPDYDIECGHLEKDPEFDHFTDAWLVNFDISTHINEFNFNKSFELFPNPANDILTVKSASHCNDMEINIFNITHQKIYSITFNNLNQISIPVSDLNNGLFYLTISKASNVIYSDLFIVQH